MNFLPPPIPPNHTTHQPCERIAINKRINHVYFSSELDLFDTIIWEDESCCLQVGFIPIHFHSFRNRAKIKMCDFS